MSDLRQKLLEQARTSLDLEQLPAFERDCLLKLLDILLSGLYEHAEQDQMRQIVEQVLTNQHLMLLVRQQAAELDALKKLSLNLTASLELTTVLDAVVAEALRLLKDVNDAHIFLYQDKQLLFGAALDSRGNRLTDWSKPRADGLTATVARTGEVIMVEDLRSHPLFIGTPEHWAGSIIGIPLKMGKRVVGVMNIARFHTGSFSDSEMRLIRLLADQAAIAIINARLHESVSRQAQTDPLTGLPNRRALDERLESEYQHAIRTGKPFAVIMMDLDGFKRINDTYGHEVGDQLLCAFAAHLHQALRSSDFLARYGGDEMTLVLAEADLAAANTVIAKIQQRMDEFQFDLPDGSRTSVQASGGIAIHPQHGRTGVDLLRAADEALYRAKRHHRGTFQTGKPMTGQLAQSPTQPMRRVRLEQDGGNGKDGGL